MKRKSRGHEGAGPSQRQLRAAELVRHALVEIVAREDFRDPDLLGVSVTIGEVRASPDLKHMTAFVSALGPADPQQIANGLTRSAAFLRGRLQGIRNRGDHIATRNALFLLHVFQD